MSSRRLSREELQERLTRAEAMLEALRRGEVDLIIGKTEPMVVRFKSIVEERERLQSLLGIVRMINQLIVHEDDPQRLLQSVADSLAGSGLFHAACIKQVHADEKAVRFFESGWSKAFLGAGSLLAAEGRPRCLANVTTASAPMIIADPQPVCTECPAKGCLDDRCVIGVALTHEGTFYGALLVSAPRSMAQETDTCELCSEIGGDLGFALRRMQEKKARQKAEEALRESEEKYRAIVENAGEVILVVQDEQIKFVNRRAFDLFGYKPEELAGKSFINYIHPEDRKTVAERYEARLRGEDLPDVYLFRVVGRTGEIRWVEINIVRIEWQGKPATLNFLLDITERRRAEEEQEKLRQQLRQAQKVEAIGRLAGGVAHDFNNMLSIILGYGENLLDQLHPEDPLRKDAAEIVEAGRRSSALTRQLLAFSRKQTLQPEVLDLNALVKNLGKMLRRLIGEDIDLKMVLAEDLARVEADPGQIEQAIMNLAVNARDAMPEGGELIIETANMELDDLYVQNHVGVKPGEYVMLAVTDTGCGMDKVTMSKVFEPFFTTKEKGKGTGLGLSTVYGIVKQSGGNVWVYSEPGQGTTFKIYLPQTHAEPKTKDGGTDKKKHGGGGEHILVVEDETSLRRLFERALSRLGYQVTIAANGDEALLLVQEKGLKPDLVITDVVMPGMGGSILVEHLQKNQPGLKVLYISGYTNNTIVHRGVLDPSTPFIQKPFNIRDLAAKVRDVLRGGGRTIPMKHDSSRNY